jgi:hypothetical protein
MAGNDKNKVVMHANRRHENGWDAHNLGVYYYKTCIYYTLINA